MALQYKPAKPLLQGQNIRPPLGSFFNGQSYWVALYPELGNEDRSVLVIKMVLQFQFEDGDEDDKWGNNESNEWSEGEKNNFAHGFVNGVVSAWAEAFRITTTSKVPAKNCRDVGVVFKFPYYIDGWHSDDDFELSVKKIPAGTYKSSGCRYSLGNTSLFSEDNRAVSKGGPTNQRDSVHEFGHMLGLRDEYTAADDNPHHTGDLNSIMNFGETIRERHYAPFAAWLTDKFGYLSRVTKTQIVYRVNGRTDISNALL